MYQQHYRTDNVKSSIYYGTCRALQHNSRSTTDQIQHRKKRRQSGYFQKLTTNKTLNLPVEFYQFSYDKYRFLATHPRVYSWLTRLYKITVRKLLYTFSDSAVINYTLLTTYIAALSTLSLLIYYCIAASSASFCTIHCPCRYWDV